MSFSFSNFADALRTGAAIAPQDVVAARQWAWSDGGITAAEADIIFELNGLAKDASAAWIDFFVEALSEFVVNMQPPRGYIDDANAAWLMARIDRDGKVETRAELALLVKAMEIALNAPESLKAYALDQIERVVTTGAGPTRSGDTLRPGVIDEAEVTLLRRLLFASGGEAGTTISRDEAETLWRLKDACLGADNGPGWKTLFVQAVGNHLMAHNLYHPLTRSDAQRLDASVADNRADTGGFLARMAQNLIRPPIGEAFAKPPATPLQAGVEADRRIAPDEAAWVRAHLKADGRRDPLEQALIAFIEEESGTQI
ncbi:MAG TPA: hypothetical protein VJ859_16110 [Allosphingosinicella sp.]|nr:hypothetical protein [Allosphingosinicella sp.]